MAKTSTTTKAKAPKTKAKPAKAAKPARAAKPVRAASKTGTIREDASDAFVKLLQSPLVADLVTVAATAALAALAEHGFRGGKGKKGAGKAVKEAGKSAAAAIGRRLKTEIDEIKKASKPKAGAAK